MDDRRERNTGRSGRESGSKRKIFRRTVFLMLVCGVGLFIPLIGQLWNIAIVHHEEYQAEAVEQQTHRRHVRHRVQGAYLMEVNLIHRYSVDVAFRLGDFLVNRQNIQLDHGGNGQCLHNGSDVM